MLEGIDDQCEDLRLTDNGEDINEFDSFLGEVLVVLGSTLNLGGQLGIHTAKYLYTIASGYNFQLHSLPVIIKIDEVFQSMDGQLNQRWMERDGGSLRRVRPEMWLLPKQRLVSRDWGCLSLKAVAASTESSVSLLLVAMRVSTIGICATKFNRWSMSASTNWHLIIRTVFTVASASSPISFSDRRQHAKLVLEASPPINQITYPVFAVLLLKSRTDYITFLLPSLFKQTFDCLITSRGMQLTKAGRYSNRRPISLLSCYPKRYAPPYTDASMDLRIDRDILDLLNVLSLLWHNSLELLVLDARSRLLEVPQILDLSSLDTLEQLLDCMFSFSRRPKGDFLTDFSISPFLSPSSHPFSARMCFTSYLRNCSITFCNSLSWLLPS